MLQGTGRLSVRAVSHALIALFSVCCGSALAQAQHKTVILLPFAKGGPSDALMRSAAPLISKALNREVVIENIIDPQGDRLNDLVSNLRRDGSVLVVLPFSAAARRLQAADSQFTPVGILLDTPLSIVVNDGFGVRDLPTLRDAAIGLNRKLRIAAPAAGTPTEMCGRQLAATLGTTLAALVSVPKEADAVTAVTNGQVDLICTNAANHRAAADPRLREIAEVRFSTSPLARSAPAPVAAAQGFDIVAPNWLGLFAPVGTDVGTVRQLSAAIARLQNDRDFADLIARLQALPVSPDQATPEGLTQSLRLAIARQK